MPLRSRVKSVGRIIIKQTTGPWIAFTTSRSLTPSACKEPEEPVIFYWTLSV
jgi:hypothetical protein